MIGGGAPACLVPQPGRWEDPNKQDPFGARPLRGKEMGDLPRIDSGAFRHQTGHDPSVPRTLAVNA